MDKRKIFMSLFLFGFSFVAAISVDNCVGRCGVDDYFDPLMDLECYCDLDCNMTEGKTCCEDFVSECNPSIVSCENRCIEAHVLNYTCHCDYLCAYYGNCCDDFNDLCLPERNTSCFGRCYEADDQNNVGCSCSSTCSEKMTCCDDFLPTCASAILCQNRCFTPRNSSLQCQCDSTCPDVGDCCRDYTSACLPPSTEATTTKAIEITCPTVVESTTSGGNTVETKRFFAIFLGIMVFLIK